MSLSSSYTLQKKIIKKLRKRAQGKEGFGKRTFGDRLGSNRIYRDFYSKR